MPVTPTYPGVYVEEIPSGVRTIVGVATSITAFIGRASKGPVNDATRVRNFGDFERKFGGLWSKSTMSYAVYQYFQSGGTEAVIVRITHNATAASVSLVAGPLVLNAKSDGSAGNDLTVTITHDSVSDPDSFNLIVKDGGVVQEEHNDISISELEDELDNNSTLIEVSGTVPSSRPDEVEDAELSGGSDGAEQATVSLSAGSGNLVLDAANPGDWSNYLRATVDHDTATPSDETSFNLLIEELDDDDNVVSSETFRNLSTDDESSRYVTSVLEEESDLVRVTGTVPDVRPGEVDDAEFTLGADGDDLVSTDYQGSESAKTGLYALEDVDLFNLLCIPPPTWEEDTSNTIYSIALEYCADRRAILIVDSPSSWNDVGDAEEGLDTLTSGWTTKKNGTLFFPRVRMADPLQENRLDEFVPCGVIAGIIARTDAQRGLWKAPAGIEATLTGVNELSYKLTDAENGTLNPLGINCLRTFPVVGNVVWGARTLDGADRLASEWKYIPVRRVALYIEESLYRGTQWVVFEPNDEPLWAQIRLNVGAFMHNLFRQGAFQGKSPKEAYFVKCDSETTTQNDINLGIVNVLVGFAPLKPAEFVMIKIQQIAGQVEA